MLLRSFRHFLITVSETDSNEISSNLNFPLPFQINLKLPFSPPLVMFQKNCLFLQVGTSRPARASPTPHKASPAGGHPQINQTKTPFSNICSLWWDMRQANLARENAHHPGFCSGARSGSAELPAAGGPPARPASLPSPKGHSLCLSRQEPQSSIQTRLFPISSSNHGTPKPQEGIKMI